MKRTLSLHPLNALDAGPVELIAIAGALGIDAVCLFTHVPEGAAGRYPLVTRADIPAVSEALEVARVRLCNLEVFPLDRDGEPERFAEALEVGAALGATRATAHIHAIESETQAADRFAAFAEQAAAYAITPGLEFNGFSAIRDAVTAARIVRQAGAGALILDTLHFVRNGGVPADAVEVADVVGYVQISDGPPGVAEDARWTEAVVERALPGEGSFPLVDILHALPPEAIYEVEVPQTAARKAGVSAAERCRRSVEAMRRVLARVDAENTP